MLVYGIRLYQRYISPYKGFRCGFALINNTCSCSAFAQRAIAKHGTYAGWKLAKHRMKRCGQAVALYQKRLKKGHLHLKNSKRPNKGKKEDMCDLPFYVCDCADLLSSFGKCSQAKPKKPSPGACDFDIGPCDGSGLDIGCDIAGCSP